MDKQLDILTKISSAAYLLVFIAICVSVGFSKDFLMLLNGVFFVIYLLSLWNTGTDTFDFYDNKYFAIDMLSVAVYANIPRLYLSGLGQEQFFCTYWTLFALNEAICVIWDYICHCISSNEHAKGFHMTWTLLTVIGIFIMAMSVVLIKTDILAEHIIIINIVNVIYQFALLLAWWISKYKIEKKAIES